MTIFVLLIIYQLKHFLADYPLQGKYMLQKFKPGWDFVLPLLAHVGVHAFFTAAIAIGALCITHPNAPQGWIFKISGLLALFDASVHFAMDRIKASPKYLGRFKSLSSTDFSRLKNITEAQTRGNKLFWWSLGLDQMVHHLTHYAIIWVLVTR